MQTKSWRILIQVWRLWNNWRNTQTLDTTIHWKSIGQNLWKNICIKFPCHLSDKTTIKDMKVIDKICNNRLQRKINI
jgi:hypothetical protein